MRAEAKENAVFCLIMPSRILSWTQSKTAKGESRSKRKHSFRFDYAEPHPVLDAVKGTKKIRSAIYFCTPLNNVYQTFSSLRRDNRAACGRNVSGKVVSLRAKDTVLQNEKWYFSRRGTVCYGPKGRYMFIIGNGICLLQASGRMTANL